jgi:RNA-binding protein 39
VRDEFDPPEFDEDREQNRDDFTIFVHQIHPKVDDRDLFDFFSHVGRVLDIRLIRDQRTLKSKGYVAFR